MHRELGQELVDGLQDKLHAGVEVRSMNRLDHLKLRSSLSGFRSHGVDPLDQGPDNFDRYLCVGATPPSWHMKRVVSVVEESQRRPPAQAVAERFEESQVC